MGNSLSADLESGRDFGVLYFHRALDEEVRAIAGKMDGEYPAGIAEVMAKSALST